MGELLADCRAVSAADVEAIWIDEEFARDAQQNNPVRNWGAFPCWHPQRGSSAMPAQVVAERAREAGLRNRPVRETARDTLDWWQTLSAERQSNLNAGLAPAYETELIARWREGHA